MNKRKLVLSVLEIRFSGSTVTCRAEMECVAMLCVSTKHHKLECRHRITRYRITAVLENVILVFHIDLVTVFPVEVTGIII